MAQDSVVSRIGMSIMGTAAKRPRFAMTLVLLVLLMAAQGTVGAASFDLAIGTNGSGTINSGP